MQNIQVRRYSDPIAVGYYGWLEPDDGSWTLFVPVDGPPALWLRVSVDQGDGKTESQLVPARDVTR